MVAIVGPIGSGKSTLAKLLNGILIPSEGVVRVDSLSTTYDDIYEIRKRVGLVFQNPDNQIVASIVERDVAFALENLGVPRDEMVRRVEYSLEITSLLSKRNSLTHALSGGQKQRLAIAGILAMKPDYIVLDEPFAMLDPKGKGEVLHTLFKLRDEGITIILVTQYMDTILEFPRVICMNSGEIVYDGEVESFFSDWDRIHSLNLEVPLVYRMVERIKRVAGIKLSTFDLDSYCDKLVENYGKRKTDNS
jgi:energy-coupling factor transport system ATP-binding protein